MTYVKGQIPKQAGAGGRVASAAGKSGLVRKRRWELAGNSAITCAARLLKSLNSLKMPG